MGNAFQALRSVGLTNSHTSYDDFLGTTRRQVSAYCHSKQCAGKKSRVRKDLKNKPDECPDCGDFLKYISENVSVVKA